MFARQLYRVADIAMVGLAIGPAAIAGLAFASIFWQFANAFAIGLTGGTLMQVSQQYGIGRYDRIDTVVKQSIWIGAAVMVPFFIAFWFFSTPLIELVAGDLATTRYGASYLQLLSIALLFNVANLVFSRALAGADDTWIAMSVRATGAFVNIALNMVFIFGLGMGVAGAAMGTIIAEAVVMMCLTWGFFTGGLPVLGSFPITISVDDTYFDGELAKQLLIISPPLVFERLAETLARFPLFAILAAFGPLTVAAFEVARRIRTLMEATGNGFSMAASSLVGQELGRGAELEVDRYAQDVIRFSAVLYVIAALLVFVLSEPLAHFFAENPRAVSETVPFIRIAALSFVGAGLAFTYAGILRGAGDNRWILYGRVVSQYVVLIPITYLGTMTQLGVFAVFIAMLFDTGTRAAIIGFRFASGEWKSINRAVLSGTTND